MQQQWHHHQRQQLGHQRQPGRHRGGVEDLVEAIVALAPDQLTRIKRDDDEHEQAKRAAQQPGHLIGDRPGLRAKKIAQRGTGKDQEQNAREDQYTKINVLDGFTKIQPHQLWQHADTSGCDGRCCEAHLWCAINIRWHVDEFLCLARSTFIGKFRKRKTPEAERGDSRGRAEPKKAIPEQHTLQRNQPRIAVGHGPVFGESTDSRSAERVDQGGDSFVVDIAQQLERDQVTDKQQHATDINRQHFFR